MAVVFYGPLSNAMTSKYAAIHNMTVISNPIPAAISYDS
jgi:hypothetical protein